MEINENQWKPMKSMKINEMAQKKPMANTRCTAKFFENCQSTLTTHFAPHKFFDNFASKRQERASDKQEQATSKSKRQQQLHQVQRHDKERETQWCATQLAKKRQTNTRAKHSCGYTWCVHVYTCNCWYRGTVQRETLDATVVSSLIPTWPVQVSRAMCECHVRNFLAMYLCSHWPDRFKCHVLCNRMVCDCFSDRSLNHVSASQLHKIYLHLHNTTETTCHVAYKQRVL